MKMIKIKEITKLKYLASGVLLGLAGIASIGRGEDWPQWFGPMRDGVWRETGLIDKFPMGGPKVLWRQPFNPGYCGPAVAAGKVYVMDRIAEPEPKTPSEKKAPERATPEKASEKTKDKEKKAPPAAAKKTAVPGKERVLCLNAADGSVHWSHEYDCPYAISYNQGPRTTPVVQDGKVFTLGAMGHLHCYDASSGSNVWQKNLLEDYKTKPPVWGYAASMLVDGDKVITLAGGKGSAVVALDKNSGKELWRALTALEVGYSPPSIIEAAGKRQLIVWLDVSVNALDPETGKTLWSIEFPSAATLQRPIVSIVPPVKFGNHLFFSEFYQGSMLLELDQQKPGARVVWQTKENNPTKPTDLNAIMTTPIIRDGHIYGIGGSGEMRCLKLETGAVVWESLKATGGKKALFAHAFIIPQGDRYVIFNDQGDLILANLTPQGYAEIDKAHLLDTTFATRGREVVWCHPAFANRCLYLHNDKEMICVSMAKEEKPKENKGT